MRLESVPGPLCGWVAALSVWCMACSPPPPPRGVILVSLDTLRADHLGAYGYERETSPHLDAFADSSVVFERAISQSSSTTPAHRALFQSRPASGYDEEGATLAELLSQAGFATAAFTGGGNIAASLGFGRGFDLYVEDEEGLAVALPQVESWLREQGDRPFFLFLHTYDIHLPYDPPAPYDALFFPEYEGPVTGAKSREILRRERRHRDSGRRPGELLSAEDQRRVVALYDGGIRYTDELMGRFFRLLEELGLSEEVAVVVFSDHGEEFWEHGSVIHSHTVYQELVHVPLILRFPAGRLGGRRVVSTVRLADVAPTLLDLLELPAPAEFQGQSLVPLVLGRPELPRPALSEINLDRSWTEYPWKLVDRDGEHELYDLASDPKEQRDLLAAEADVARELARRMVAETGKAAAEEVKVLDPAAHDPELEERLRALGYID